MLLLQKENANISIVATQVFFLPTPLKSFCVEKSICNDTWLQKKGFKSAFLITTSQSRNFGKLLPKCSKVRAPKMTTSLQSLRGTPCSWCPSQVCVRDRTKFRARARSNKQHVFHLDH